MMINIITWCPFFVRNPGQRGGGRTGMLYSTLLFLKLYFARDDFLGICFCVILQFIQSFFDPRTRIISSGSLLYRYFASITLRFVNGFRCVKALRRYYTIGLIETCRLLHFLTNWLYLLDIFCFLTKLFLPCCIQCIRFYYFQLVENFEHV